MNKNLDIFRLATVAMAVCACGIAQASVVGSIPLVNGFNFLEDDNFELLGFDRNSDGLIGVGDRFLGTLVIQNVNGTVIGPGDATITAVFAIEVLSTSDGSMSPAVPGTATSITFGPLQSGGSNAASTEWSTLISGINADFLTGITTTTPTNDATTAILYAVPDISAVNAGTGDLGDSVDTFDETAGTILGEWGDGGGVFDWSTNGTAGVDDPLNVIVQGFAATNTINLDQLEDNPADSLYLGDLIGSGGFEPLLPLPIGQPGDFQLATDTDFITIGTIVTPEPVSASVFAGLAMFGVTMISRRSRED